MTPLQISVPSVKNVTSNVKTTPISSFISISIPMSPQPEPEPESESATLLPVRSPASESDSLSERAYEASEKITIADDGGSEDSDAAPPFSWRKLWLFTGPGFLMSIGFLDPGNLEGDLQAGAVAGYSLLWLLLWATAMGLWIQMLSARIGVATGKHLAEVCREEYPTWARLALWFMAEVALIGADIQEVIGSAIAIKILSGGVMPLWAGVVITALDCFVFLFLENYGVRKLEAVFAVLIATMAISFAWMFGETKPNGKELLIGLLVPKIGSKTIRQAVGVVGCVIMPHNVFLHSALVQSRKVDTNKKSRVREAINYYTIESTVALIVSFTINLCVTTIFAKGFYGTKQANNIGLENAGHFLEEKYGGGVFPILYIWGIGLLAAGQSSTITGTYAGQFIMGGFLNLRLKKWIRALITRSPKGLIYSIEITPSTKIEHLCQFNLPNRMRTIFGQYLKKYQSFVIMFHSTIPEWEDDGYEISPYHIIVLNWCKDMCYNNGPEFVHETPLETKMELAKRKADVMYHNSKLDLENLSMNCQSIYYEIWSTSTFEVPRTYKTTEDCDSFFYQMLVADAEDEEEERQRAREPMDDGDWFNTLDEMEQEAIRNRQED